MAGKANDSRASRHFKNLITVTAVAGAKEFMVGGSVTGRDDEPRLVQALGYDVEIAIEPLMLFVVNDDILMLRVFLHASGAVCTGLINVVVVSIVVSFRGFFCGGLRVDELRSAAAGVFNDRPFVIIVQLRSRI